MLTWPDDMAKRGYSSSWRNRRHDIKAEFCQIQRSLCLHAKVILTQVSNDDIKKPTAHNSEVFGASHENLLAVWITVASRGWVVLIDNEVVKYLILRKTIRFFKEGYHTAPFFADDLTIAEVFLIKAAMQ